jgi:hypothetical protein
MEAVLAYKRSFYNHMKPTLKTKVLGTFVFVVLALGVSFMSYSNAFAKLVTQGTKVNATGTILSMDTEAQSFVFQGTATGVVTVYVTEDTVFGSNLTGLADLSAGDTIQLVDQKTEGINYALKIREINSGAGYGYGTNQVSVAKAMVVSTSENHILVAIGQTNIDITVNAATTFVGTTFEDIAAGDKVMITGSDTGTAYVADMITLL